MGILNNFYFLNTRVPENYPADVSEVVCVKETDYPFAGPHNSKVAMEALEGDI